MYFVSLPKKTFDVKIIKASGLKIDGKSTNKINPYVTITLQSDESQTKKTRTIMGNPNPIWNETFKFHFTESENEILYFDIKSEGTGFIDKTISKKNKLSLNSIDSSQPLIIKLQDSYGIGYNGKLYVQITLFGKLSDKKKPNLKTVSSSAKNLDSEEEDFEILKDNSQIKSPKPNIQEQELQIQNYESEIKAQNEKIQNFESEIHNYQSRIKNYESQIEEQNSRMQNFEAEIKNYQLKEQNYQSRIQNLESQIRAQNSMINNFESQFKTFQLKEKDYQSKIRNFESLIKTHQAKEQNYEKKINTYESIFLPEFLKSTTTTTQSENYFIDDDTFKLHFEDKGEIGEGATSTTYKVIDKRTKMPLCKKVLKVKEKCTIKDAQNAMKEFEFLHVINHPCICKSYYINTSEAVRIPNKRKKEETTTVSIYLEYLEYGLGEILKLDICDTTKSKIVLEITHAMNYIHKKGFIHRDLKIDNIMLNSSFQAKLVDFGLLAINESILNDSLTRGVGTLMFMSPEMLNEEKYDIKTDVYSFGVLLYSIFFGENPKQNMKDKSSRKRIEIPLSLSACVSKFCLDLINKCLSPLPLDRPSFQEILDDMKNNSFQFTEDVDPSVLIQRDKEIELIESIK